MGRKRKPGKEAFGKELQSISEAIPYYYSNDVKAILKKPELDSVYIQNVRKGLAVDWDVLEALKALAHKNAQPQAI